MAEDFDAIYHLTKKNWNILSSEQNLLLKLVTITGVNFFLFATEIAIIFNYLFKDLAILEILYYNSLSVFSSLLSITPASLGIKEFIILISNDLINKWTMTIFSNKAVFTSITTIVHFAFDMHF